MRSLFVFFQKLDDFRIKINYNQYTKVVQKDLLDEVEDLYYSYLKKRNKIKLLELGEFAKSEIIPNEIDIGSYEEILMSSDFPIEVIWSNGTPISAILPIIYNNSSNIFKCNICD